MFTLIKFYLLIKTEKEDRCAMVQVRTILDMILYRQREVLCCLLIYQQRILKCTLLVEDAKSEYIGKHRIRSLEIVWSYLA